MNFKQSFFDSVKFVNFQVLNSFRFIVIFSILLGSFLLVGIGKASAATYYVSPSGSNTAPYDTWEKSANLPSTVIDYIRTTGGAGPHTVNIGAGSYSDTQILLNHANHNSIAIMGAGQESAIITGTDHVVYSTTAGLVDDLKISGVTLIPPTDKYALYQNTGNDNWSIEDVTFKSPVGHTQRLVMLTGGVVNIARCSFYHAGSATNTFAIRIDGAASGQIYNSIVAPATHATQSGSVVISSSGSFSLTNSVIISTGSQGIHQFAGSGVLTVANSVISSGIQSSLGYSVYKGAASTGELHVHNSYLIAPLWNGASYWLYDVDTDSDNIKTNMPPRFRTNLRVGFLMPNVDDAPHFSYAQDVATVLGDYGFQGTYYVDQTGWNTDDNMDLRTMVTDGIMEVAAHGYSHSAITYDYALRIEYTGSDSNPTVEMTAGRTLQFRTTEGNDNADMDTANAIYNTLGKIITAAPSNWTIAKSTADEQLVSQLSTGVKATGLSVQGPTVAPCDLTLDRSSYDTGYFKDEILDQKVWLADTIINGEGNITDPQTGVTYIARTYASPFTAWDTTARSAAINSGFVLARATLSSAMSGMTRLVNADLFEAVQLQARLYLDGSTEAEIRQQARAMAVAAINSGLAIAVLAHNADEFTLDQWNWACDEWSNFDSSLVVTSNQLFADYVRNSGLWTDNGDGTYSRTYLTYTDYYPMQDSPLIDVGIDTELTTDYAGNPIYGTPDIGAYEYQPPYTFASDDIPTTGSVRLYSDGQYRMTTSSSTTAIANFSVTPAEGSYYATTTQYMDITINSWLTSGTYNKQWTATSTAGDFLTHATSTIYTIGDLAPNTYYQFKLDGTASTTAITGSTCNANASCLSDSSGSLTFTYSGGYSTHIFALEKDVTAPTAFIPSSPANNFPISNSKPTLSWNASSDTESGLAKYQLYIDSVLDTDNISISAISINPTNALSCGSHTWYIRAYDNNGNYTNSDTYNLTMVCGSPSYQPTFCSTVLYDEWQTSCVNGWQYRNVKSQSPFGCALTSAQENDRKRQCGSTAPAVETIPTTSSTLTAPETTASGSKGNITLELIKNDAAIINADNVNQLVAEMDVKRDITSEANYSQTIVGKIVKDTGASNQTRNTITNFITYGTQTTLSLGAGERAGVVNSFKAAFTKLPATQEDWNDVIKIANGRWPGQISKTAEDRATINFRKVYLRTPDRKNPHDDAAITVMAYGLRPAKRNFESEKAAIKTFKAIYGYTPSTATAWDVVRAIAYSGATR